MKTFEKILLATQTINFLGFRLNDIAEEMSRVPYEGIARSHNEALERILICLNDAVQQLGDHMNNHDMTDDDDDRHTEAAFEVLNTVPNHRNPS